ncbi:MAG: archaeal proteasome endopeptidase complex subunit alpha [Nanoarchaeales archaeon]|nr:archaeal proteasome endopeptidase complex subunit alpha [Nanoarchaeales archaeon]
MENTRQHQEMGYDRSVGMFSPAGVNLQIEYAEKAVTLGAPVLAITTKNGLVYIADRRLKSKLLVKNSIKKVVSVDNHMIISGAGVMSDGRRLIEQSQVIAQEHRIKYQTEMDVLSLVKDLANIKQHYSQSGGVRPFGVSLLIGAVEDNKVKLYQTTPSGMYLNYLAKSVGTGSAKMDEYLEENYKENISTKDAIKLGLNAFKKVQDNNFDLSRLEVVTLDTEEKFTRLSESEINKFK